MPIALTAPSIRTEQEDSVFSRSAAIRAAASKMAKPFLCRRMNSIARLPVLAVCSAARCVMLDAATDCVEAPARPARFTAAYSRWIAFFC